MLGSEEKWGVDGALHLLCCLCSMPASRLQRTTHHPLHPPATTHRHGFVVCDPQAEKVPLLRCFHEKSYDRCAEGEGCAHRGSGLCAPAVT